MILKHIPQKALIVESIHIDKLLNGSGSWEMVGGIHLKSEPIALINLVLSQIVGIANLIAVKRSVDFSIRKNNVNEHRISDEDLKAGHLNNWDVIWTLDQAQRLTKLIPVNYPTEDETWINLDESIQVELALSMALTDSDCL